jgi:hypothetical protein
MQSHETKSCKNCWIKCVPPADFALKEMRDVVFEIEVEDNMPQMKRNGPYLLPLSRVTYGCFLLLWRQKVLFAFVMMLIFARKFPSFSVQYPTGEVEFVQHNMYILYACVVHMSYPTTHVLRTTHAPHMYM